MVDKPVHMSGSLINCVYIKKTLTTEFSINATVENIYFSGHDHVRIVIEQNNVYFHTATINPI